MPEQTPNPILNARHFSKRLLNSLEVMAAAPLTVSETPAGYGKTVAAREFLRRKAMRTVSLYPQPLQQRPVQV